MIKPNKLKPWDKVIALSLSFWWPWEFPHRYNIWKKQLEERFWLQVIEWYCTLKDTKWIYDNPQERANDLHQAFLDPTVKAIFSTIWWDESIRILPYINFDIIKANPKVFIGYSDTTITHFICHKAWITSFYGPAIMAWFWENGGLFSYMNDSIERTIFSNQPIWTISENSQWRTNEFLGWSNPNNQNIKRKLNPSSWRRRIQGEKKVEWKLLGWCLDVFPYMRGTKIWPEVNSRTDKIMFIETSEEKMSTIAFERIIRNLGSQWILQRIKWIILGRSQMDYKTWIQINYDKVLLKVVRRELGLNELPIVTNMDFGHTDPMFVLPYWVNMSIDPWVREIKITEEACL